jgi:hypothetical protein
MFGLGYWHINWITSKQVRLRIMLQMQILSFTFMSPFLLVVVLSFFTSVFRFFSLSFFFLSSWVHSTWIMQCNRRVYRNSMQSKWVSLYSNIVCQTRFHFPGFQQLFLRVAIISAFCSSMHEFFCIFNALTLSCTQSGLSPADSERIGYTVTAIWHPEAQI